MSLGGLIGASEVNRVLDWLPRAPASFDAKFVYSLKARIDQGFDLTDRQLHSIRNIISKFVEKTSRPALHISRGQYYKLNDPLSHFY